MDVYGMAELACKFRDVRECQIEVQPMKEKNDGETEYIPQEKP